MASAPPSKRGRRALIAPDDAIRRLLDPAALESLAATLLTAIGLPPDIVRTALGVAERIAGYIRIVMGASIDVTPFGFVGVAPGWLEDSTICLVPATITIERVVKLVRRGAFSRWYARAHKLNRTRHEAAFVYKSLADRERLTNVYLYPAPRTSTRDSEPGLSVTLRLWDARRAPEPGFAIPPKSKLLTYAGSGLASPPVSSAGLE